MNAHRLALAAVLGLSLAACQSSGDGSAPAKWTEMTPSANYPLTTCPVSGHSLAENGKPVAIDYLGTEVQLCCRDCLEEFSRDPARYAAAAKAAQKK
jgi:hypothetical protein